jgi:hypothetical protein
MNYHIVFAPVLQSEPIAILARNGEMSVAHQLFVESFHSIVCVTLIIRRRWESWTRNTD